MLWIVKKDMSHQIMSCNTHYDEEKDKHQLWITRPNGKNMKIEESSNQQDIDEIKEAIDFAIENKEGALRIS